MRTPPTLLKQSTDSLLVLLVALLLLGGCSSSPSRSGDQPLTVGGTVQRQFDRAVTLMKAGQYSEAIPVLEQLTEKNPSLAGPWINLGIARARIGETQSAVQALKKAIEVNAASPAAYTQLGMVYRSSGDFEASRKAYLDAITVDPQYSYAHRNLGILFEIYLQQPDYALQHYKRYQALQAEPDKEVQKWIVELERRVQSRQVNTEVARQ
jgi:tetratricopeptide (TPR) repeat protein